MIFLDLFDNTAARQPLARFQFFRITQNSYQMQVDEPREKKRLNNF